MVRHLMQKNPDRAQFLLPTQELPAEVAREPTFRALYLMVSCNKLCTAHALDDVNRKSISKCYKIVRIFNLFDMSR